MGRRQEQTIAAVRGGPWMRHGPYLAGLGVVVVMLVLSCLNLWRAYHDKTTQAHSDVRNLVGILEQNIAGRLHTVDYALTDIADKIEDALKSGTSEWLFADIGWLEERRARLPQSPHLLIIDAEGIVSSATTLRHFVGVDVSDRAYFRNLRDMPDLGLIISTPYESRVTPGVWAIALARAFTNPDGAFGGVVMAPVNLAALSSSFADINVGRGGAVAMWNAESVLLARYPPLPANIGQTTNALAPQLCTSESRATNFEGKPPDSDMPIRIAACRRLVSYPLVVSVGLGRDDVLASWRRDVGLHGSVLALFAALVFGMAWYVAKLHEAALGSADARLRDAIESIGEGLALYDAEGRLEVWNAKLVEHFPHLVKLKPLAGRTYEEILRASLHDMGDPEARQNPEAFVARRLRERANPSSEPSLRPTADGRWFLVHERPTSHGGMIVVRTDVTVLKRNEERLEQLAASLAAAKRQAEEASLSKTRFLASMSHELRTPLNAIIGFSEIIENQLLGPRAADRYADYARDIRRSGVHLLELINDILDMSKIEAGKREIIDEMLDLNEIGDSCLRMLRAHAAEAHVKLESSIPEGLRHLRADRRAIKQILLNLLSNSVKFTPSGGRVLLDARLDDDGRIQLAVSDSGVGIPRDQLAKVFEPFRQVDRLGEGKPEGTGLGLSICRGLIEAHDGSIAISSEVGSGTLVTVTFPAERTVDFRAAVTAD